MMWEFVLWLKNAFNALVNTFNAYHFSFGGIDVTLYEIMLGLLCMSIVISVFWKGARG